MEKGACIATYIDDWLLAAQSQQQISVHSKLLISHLIALGFTVNLEKKVLVPIQNVKFIGLALASVALKARLSVESVSGSSGMSPQGHVTEIQDVSHITGTDCISTGGRPIRMPAHEAVPVLGFIAQAEPNPPLSLSSIFTLTTVVTMGAILARKVVTTNASRAGWVPMHESRIVNGTWGPQMRGRKCLVHRLLGAPNCVAGSETFFLPLLREHHVLVRTDKTMVVAYTNRQGGLRSRHHHMSGATV